MGTVATFVGLPPRDRLGRLKAFSDSTLPTGEFIDLCVGLEREAADRGGSRWTVRSLVEPGAAAGTEILAALSDGAGSHDGGPLEVNRLPVELGDGAIRDYLWVARNLGDRVPPPSVQAGFLAKVNRRVETQESLFDAHAASSTELLDVAEASGWSVACNDPIGDWGTGGVDGATFRSLLQQLFWFDRDQAAAMLRGEGYSTRGHYVFSISDGEGEALCVFVLARFAWGFEGTYTMVNPLLPLSRTARAARTLMLIANALVLGRHGSSTLLYGEANAGNIPACLTAGYAVQPPRGCEPDSPLHENIVWADNPIGTVRSIGTDLETPIPPSHRQAEYSNYALMRARNALILPFRERASEFLRDG